MPNSYSNKPGFYDDGDGPATNNQNQKPSESSKPSQDTNKKSKGPNDNAKRFVNNHTNYEIFQNEKHPNIFSCVFLVAGLVVSSVR